LTIWAAIRLKKFLLSWLINTLAVLVAFFLVPGIHYQKPLDLCAASLLLGVLNAILRPLLIWLTLPLVLLTLGLFMLVINGLLLYLVSWLLQPHFQVDGFWDAFKGALVISVVATVLNWMTGAGNSRVRVQVHRRPPENGSGGGPVIDV
jgi:putative membrane protein